MVQVRRCGASGMDAHLSKPLRMDALSTLNGLLGGASGRTRGLAAQAAAQAAGGGSFWEARSQSVSVRAATVPVQG